MTVPQDISSRPSGFASIPLAVAYIAVPLGTAITRYMGGAEVSAMGPWLLLAAIGTLLALYRPTPGAKRTSGFVVKAITFLLLVTGFVFYASDILASLITAIPYLYEATPLIFLLFAALWCLTCGMPDRADFQRYGAVLGLVCIIDTLAEAALYHAVPSIRWFGNADILAGLLLISLCAGLRPGENQGGVDEPDQGHRAWRALVMLGLLTCLSRTALFAAAWVVLCFGRGRISRRVLYSLACVAALTLSLFLPTTPSDATRYTDYWLWVEAIRLFTATPSLLLTGFPVNAPLPLDFPIGMSAIWEAATGMPSTAGAFLSQVPSFWLRLILAWGISAPIALLSVLFVLLVRRLTRLGAGLTAALFAQGMTTPLLYDPAFGAMIGLAFVLALSAPKRKANIKHAPPPEAAPNTETNEANAESATEEWNLRPL